MYSGTPAPERAGRVGRRDDHVGQPRERGVFGGREERRRVRAVPRACARLSMHVLAVELVARERKGARRGRSCRASSARDVAFRSQLTSLQPLGDVLGGPRRERHDRVRRVLLRRRREHAAVDDIEVRHVVRAAVARSTTDVRGSRPMRQPPSSWLVAGAVGHGQDFRAGLLEHRQAPANHVVEQRFFVVAPTHVAPRQRQAERVLALADRDRRTTARSAASRRRA